MATRTTKAKGKGITPREVVARTIVPPAPAASPGAPEDRISKGEGAAILGVSIEQFDGIVARGCLSVYRLPGCRPKYLRSEVEELARRSLVPATAGVDHDED